MKKIKLYGIGNFENFNYYIFDKKQKVAEEIDKLFYAIFGDHWDFEVGEEKNGKWFDKKINIENYKDIHEVIMRKPRIDVFFGGKKMFLAIHCSEKLRAKFNEKLSKVSIMPKPKKKK